MRIPFAWGFMMWFILAGVSVAGASPLDVEQQTRRFLDAYARGDGHTVLPMLDKAVVIYGSDSEEFFRGTDAAMLLFAQDHQLWGGVARIGPMEHVTTVRRGTFASIFFDADFSAGGRSAVIVRFAMIWKLVAGKWVLMQSSNVVPTHGQSAAQLLKGQ